MHPNVIATLLQKLKHKIFLKSSGLLSSHIKGSGFDFAEINTYIPGMDARKIYWNSLAKGQELQIKSYYEEREINVVVAILLTGSLRFGEPIQKYEKLLETAAILGYNIIQGNNFFQGFCWSEKNIIITPPNKAQKAIDTFIQKCASIDPLYTHINTSKALEALFQKIRKKSLLFILSDFLEDIDLTKLAQKHEIVVLIVRDSYEKKPLSLGEGIFMDPESGDEIELVLNDKIARIYHQHYIENDQKLLYHLRKLGIKYMFVYSDQDTLLTLSHL